MSDEYRDPLAAAHARIAELEEKVAQLEADKGAPRPVVATGQFVELEAKIERLRIRADERRYAARRVWLTWIGVLFPLSSAVFSYLRLPSYIAAATVLFVGVAALNAFTARRLKADKLRLAEAEAQLASAQRLSELEATLAERQPKARIAAEPLTESEPDATARSTLRS